MSESFEEYNHEGRLLEGKELFRNAMCPSRHIGKINKDQDKDWFSRFTELEKRLKDSWTCALCGNRGTGKTQMAVELMRSHTFINNRSCLYEKVMGFFMKIKQTYSKKSEKTEEAIISEYIRPDLLIIDEAHERAESDWENRLLTYLIDRRYDAMKKTLLISNLKPEEFLKSIGPSIASRLSETGSIMVCNWKSFREREEK